MVTHIIIQNNLNHLDSSYHNDARLQQDGCKINKLVNALAQFTFLNPLLNVSKKIRF